MEFSEHCGENLLKMIVEEVDKLYETYSGTELERELERCSSLGHRLLEHDYFNGLEKLTDECGKAINLNNYALLNKSLDSWSLGYDRCMKVKQQDYDRFFTLISKNIEEMC